MHLDAVFADDGEGGQHLGGPEKYPDLIAKFMNSTLQPVERGDTEPNHHAEAHAVHADEFGEVEQGPF